MSAKETSAEAEWRSCPHAFIRHTASFAPGELTAWLQEQTPDTWHVVAAGWDYNNNQTAEGLDWILSQPECDLASAATVYYTDAINLMTEDPDKLSGLYRENWRVQQKIALNLQRGFYKHARYVLDIEESDIAWHDEFVERQRKSGKKIPWPTPSRNSLTFGKGRPQSPYTCQQGDIGLTFETWRRRRLGFEGCGARFPACCDEARAARGM